ncbi:MAG: chemotaxis protein CheW [Halocynthiibacter sp.]
MQQAQTKTESSDLEMVAFRTASQDFCIDIMSVREIRGWVPATVLPHAPHYIRGVINLRGTIVPIFDLSARLGLGTLPSNDRNVIIIANIDSQTIGLLVEAVSDILAVASDTIQPVPEIAEAQTNAFIKGVIPGEASMVRLIDIQNVMSEIPVPAQ